MITKQTSPHSHSSKTYLITGAAGFIGARFIESCNALGHRLFSVDDLEHFKKRQENKNLDFGKQIDRSNLFTWLNSLQPHFDGIIHLGAITDTRETNEQRLNQLNLEYSKNLWIYASKNKIPYIYASSAATYGDGLNGYDDIESKISELKPLNLYGESKLKFDIWALAQEKLKNSPPSWAGFKFFNVYGFGERHKNFMSSVVLHAYDQIQKTGQVTLFKSHKEGIADGEQKRDFIYVEDVVQALHFALEKPILRGIFNLGTGQARSFLDLARSVFSALGKPENIQFIDTPIAIRDKYQYFTQAEMKRLRFEGFKLPFTDLEVGTQKYIERLVKY